MQACSTKAQSVVVWHPSHAGWQLSGSCALLVRLCSMPKLHVCRPPDWRTQKPGPHSCLTACGTLGCPALPGTGVLWQTPLLDSLPCRCTTGQRPVPHHRLAACCMRHHCQAGLCCGTHACSGQPPAPTGMNPWHSAVDEPPAGWHASHARGAHSTVLGG